MSEADDAYLRAAFEEASQNQAGWLLPLFDRHGQPTDHPYHRLYARTVESEGGLAMIQEIQLLRDEIDRLERHLWAMTKVLNAGPVAYRAVQMETQ